MNMSPSTDKHPQLLHQAFGAQLLQATLPGLPELFYCSPLSLTEALTGALTRATSVAPPASQPSVVPAPVRGGVPVLFPQFAEYGPLPKHGMARNAHWQLDELQSHANADVARMQYSLNIHVGDYTFWPHAAKLVMSAQASASELTLTLNVTNTGTDAFSWSGGLHPYFAVDDLLASELEGLAGVGVRDRYDAAASVQPDAPLSWSSEPCERLYAQAPDLILDTGIHRLRLSASGFDQWMVWNPGEDGARQLGDLPDTDWRRFVCVEPVCVRQPVVLEAGKVFTGQLRIARL